MLRFPAAMVLCLALARLPALAQTLPDPAKLYGDDMLFTVWRSGSEIGQHRVIFAPEDGGLTVRSILELAVKILGITVYRYTYRSQEVWQGDRLVALSSTIDDNGTPRKVEAKMTAAGLAVTGPAASETIARPILPSTHWNPATIAADRLLNTLSGKVDQVKLVPEGVETVPTGAGPRPATHYLYTGEIHAESWYDADGHWLKLRFPGKDGTPIDYVCVRCLAPAP